MKMSGPHSRIEAITTVKGKNNTKVQIDKPIYKYQTSNPRLHKYKTCNG